MNKETRFDNHYLIDNRQIRIFLSSTFSDMQAERSALVKTFETLKIEAIHRNVTLSVIDLRWGVTDEEARSGKVLSVCLNEIEHSHPFFIGLLGSHYGTSPKAVELTKNPELKERYPWIEEDVSNGLSITEIEIQYGVLRNNSDIDAAFFIKQSHTPDDSPKLSALKKKIREQKQHPVKDYTTIEDLCNKVENEVLCILNRHFPEKDYALLDQERISQRAYINIRHSHYIKNQNDFDRISGFVQSDESNLVISGLSGMGKSALIANWIKENENREDVNIIYHFISNAFAFNDNNQILKHICDEIYDLYDIEKKHVPNGTIEDEAQRILLEAKQKGDKPLLIVLDGINQIDEQNDSKLLNWLPNAPSFVKYLFSTTQDDETMHTFVRRECSIYPISVLSSAQREDYIINYLASVGKALTKDQIDKILQCPISDNMLFLRTLLDELIVFGSHEELDNRVSFYLSANNLDEFFQIVLKRMENDYSLDNKMVQHALSLIAVSEQGLSEDEIISIANIRQIDWYLFYCAFYNHFINLNGRLRFSHQYISNAVENRYHLDQPDKALPYRKEIIQFFENTPINDYHEYERKVMELSFQYYQTKNNENLHSIVLDYNAFNVFNQSNNSTLALYWRALLNDDRANYRLSDYLDVPLEPYGIELVDEETGHEYIWYRDLPLFQIGEFAHTFFVDYDTARMLLEKARSMMTDNNPALSTYYNDLGTIYYEQGAYEKAIDSYNNALQIQGAKNETLIEVAKTYNLIGLAFYGLGQYDQSLDYYQRSVGVFIERMGDDCFELVKCYNNIAMVNVSLCNYPDAMNYYNKALSLAMSHLGENNLFVSNILNNVGELYNHMGNSIQAQSCLEKSFSICATILGEDHPRTLMTKDNIGSMLFSMGKYKEALECFNEGLRIMNSSNRDSRPTLSAYYVNIGSVYNSMGDYQKALDCYNRSLEIKRSFLPEEHEDFALLYNNIGSVYVAIQEYEDALRYYEQALSLYRKLFGDDNPNVALVYNNISEIYIIEGRYEEAIELQNKAIAIKKKVFGENYPSIAINYNFLGSIYSETGNTEKAIEYYNKACSIFINCYGEHYPNLAICYHNIGDLLKDEGEFFNAMEYYLKALLIEMKTYGIESEAQIHPRITNSIMKILLIRDKIIDLPEKLESMDPELKWLFGTLSVFSK